MANQYFPVLKCRTSRPSQKFYDWVAQYGVTRLARSLGMGRSSVNRWLCRTANRKPPSMETALKIVELSKINPLSGHGALTLADVLGRAVIDSIEVHS